MDNEPALLKNTFYIEVSGAGLPEVDGLFVPSTAPPAISESGTQSTVGYWNGKFAWDRADGNSQRSPALSYSNSYSSWRICRADGHLAYDITCDDGLPPTDRPWHVYKKGVAPAPKIVLHHFDPRLPCPAPNIVFVLGGPGAGKGTMCELAQHQLGWAHLSTGELIRADLATQGTAAAEAQASLAAGQLASSQYVVTLLKQEMESITRTTGNRNFLLDGFPRSLDNIKAWHEIFGEHHDLPKMLYFECPYDVLEKRILARAKYTGRNDDNIDSLKLRFDTFRSETLPTVERFRERGKCVEIDTSLDRQSVYEMVRKNLSEHTDHHSANKPLSARAEMLLGLRPFPKI